METARTVTPQDFFLWLGRIVGLYGSIIALLALLFEYINRSFPDALAGYVDPYASAVHVSMATLIVLVPLTVLLSHLIRASIRKNPAKENIWVRRWAIVLTLFLAGVVVAIDLITLFTTFLGGEVTVRFALKVLAVLLVGVWVFLHFLAERWGYWLKNEKKTYAVAVAAILLNILVIAGGFIIVGTPQDMRLQRFDAQRVSDLQSLQWKIVEHYQQKEVLPRDLSVFNDPISSFMVPVDPQTRAPYTYETDGKLSFTLCAVFARDSVETIGQGEYAGRNMTYPSKGISDTWKHGVGETCFTRTIDPDLYPPFSKSS